MPAAMSSASPRQQVLCGLRTRSAFVACLLALACALPTSTALPVGGGGWVEVSLQAMPGPVLGPGAPVHALASSAIDPARALHKRAILPQLLAGNMSALAYGYFGNVTLGTPSQVIPNILFDTGSYYFWVKGTDCTACTGVKYDPSASSSLEAIPGQTGLTSSRYTDGNAMSGYLVKDSVIIAGQVISGLTFVAATNLTGFGSSVNGIVGLSLAPSGVFPDTFWDKLVAAGQVNSSVYSYWLDETDNAGGLLFGGVDRARLNGSITWVPMEPRPDGKYISWSARLMTINGNASILANASGVSAMFDTGTSLIHTSLGVAERLHENLGFPDPPAPISTYTLTFMDCPNRTIPAVLKPATFTMANGVNLTLQPAQYLRYLDVEGYDTQCISLFTGLTSLAEGRVIFGNGFLKNYLTVYDTGNVNVGFAPVNRAPALATNYSVLTSNELLARPASSITMTSTSTATPANLTSALAGSTTTRPAYATTSTRTTTRTSGKTSASTTADIATGVPKSAHSLPVQRFVFQVLMCAFLVLLPLLGGLL